jgi:hypothetical protein
MVSSVCFSSEPADEVFSFGVFLAAVAVGVVDPVCVFLF